MSHNCSHPYTCDVYFYFRGEIDYYHGNKSLPIYERTTKSYSREEIACILCNPALSEELICSTQPVSIENNVSFVIDLSKLKDPNDVRADDLGAWKCTGSRILQCIVKCSNSTCHVVSKLCPGATKISIRRQYFVHATDHDLHRMIAFVENTSEGTII